MMNKRIRSMIDEIFSEMKMTAENLALRDELMANAQARYEDAVAQGADEETAFREVADSLEDVYGLLEEMKRMDAQPVQEATQEAEQEEIPQMETGTQAPEQPKEQTAPQTDLGDALDKAFTALGDFGQALMPEAKKLYGQMDDITGGVLGRLGKAAKKGMQDAQKAAGEAIDRLSRESGELVFDFGPKKQEAPQKETAQQLREEAKDIRAQAEMKEAAGDPEGARELRAKAYALETRAEAMEQADAMEAARRDAERAAQYSEPLVDEDGEVNEDAFSRAVDEMAREAHEAARQAEHAQEPEYRVVGDEPVAGVKRFPAAGLHRIDVQLDADDVAVELTDGAQVEALWEARDVDGEPAFELSGHVLSVRRKNPDVFKTFFSVIKKNGGRVTVRIPRGYGLSYKISTTSGDVALRSVDADEVTVSTTSGDVRIEPDATTRLGAVKVTTVSGHAAVSASADDVAVTTVSGNQFISCDAHKVDVNVVSGRVHVEGACDEWEISAVSSDVELLCTVAPTRRIQISSMHGDVRIALPGDIRGFVAESTGAFGCEIVNEFGANRYGTCALPIRMETMRGRLMITRL